MSEKTKQFYKDFAQSMGAVRKEMPAQVKGFGALFEGTMAAGALGVKEKELIAMAIGLALQCVPCVALHVKKCLGAGATREEILDAAGVAVMMRGGPCYTYLPEVIAALDACDA